MIQIDWKEDAEGKQYVMKDLRRNERDIGTFIVTVYTDEELSREVLESIYESSYQERMTQNDIQN
jgi:hypothetical protein